MTRGQKQRYVCSECKGEVAQDAQRCPHCGHKLERQSLAQKGLLAFCGIGTIGTIGLFVVSWLLQDMGLAKISFSLFFITVGITVAGYALYMAGSLIGRTLRTIVEYTLAVWQATVRFVRWIRP